MSIFLNEMPTFNSGKLNYIDNKTNGEIYLSMSKKDFLKFVMVCITCMTIVAAAVLIVQRLMGK
jgi:hypothetical protein